MFLANMKKGCGPADERVPNVSKKRSRSLTMCNEECVCSEDCCCKDNINDNEVEPDKLHVVIPINNYVMYENRYKLFERCITQLQAVSLKKITFFTTNNLNRYQILKCI